MRVDCYQTLESLQPLARSWKSLAGESPFRSWTWQSTWQQHYVTESKQPEGLAQGPREMLVFTVVDDSSPSGEIVAVLPCYLERSLLRGSVLRLCGDGEVCSDHLGLLTKPQHATTAARAIAEHLTNRDDWDLLEFEFLDQSDKDSLCLVEALQHFHCQVTQLPGPQCWAIALPDSWEGFLEMQSKSHRKHLRRLMRSETALHRTTWRPIETLAEFPSGWETLINLHQRRRNSLGEPGCFASHTWAAFHRDVARRLLETGTLRLSLLELDGTPAAAEYQLASATTTYGYQGGLDPDRLDDQPGRISLVHTIRRAIDQGHCCYDLLRGDESYKPHWRAKPAPTVRLLAVPPRTTSRFRHQTWSTLRQAKQLAQQAVGLLS